MGSGLIQTLTLNKEPGEADYEQMKQQILTVVGGHFRPEFINRIDEVVVFHPLGKEQLHGIAQIQLGLLQKRLAERDLQLQVAEPVLDKICEAGFDPVYGARPLKRAIQNLLENPLAQDVLAGKFVPGDIIKAELDGELIVFGG